MKIYISFGQGHVHNVLGKVFDKNCLAEIECENHLEGRKVAFELFGDKFFTSYESTDGIMHHFPRGVIRVIRPVHHVIVSATIEGHYGKLKAEDLRLGNLILRKGLGDSERWDEIKVRPYDVMACTIKPEHFRPIRLSEDWMNRCGGGQCISDHFRSVKIGGSLLCVNPENGAAWIERDGVVINVTQPIQYVHQFQNLCFAWTGEELTFADGK